MLTAVRFVHYVSAIAWVGATLVPSLVVFPAIDRCDGRVRAPVMRALARRIAPWEVGASLLVILSGGAQAVLQHRLDGGLGTALQTTWGRAIGVGLFGLTLYLARRRGFSPFEMVSISADAALVGLLRRWIPLAD